MFGMGWPEIAVILVVAMVVFGPDRLPDLARQAARMVRTVKQMTDNAKADLQREVGDEWKDLDPRAGVREMLADDAPATFQPAAQRVLQPGERPPFDDEAT